MKKAFVVMLAAAMVYSLQSCKKESPANRGKSTEKIKEINACANPPSFVGVRTVGGAANDYGRKITIDPNGDVTVNGVFRHLVDFDPGTGVFNLDAPKKMIGTTTYLYGIFNQKSNSSGAFISAVMPGYYTQISEDITDAQGNKYVLGAVDASGGSGPAYLSLTKYNGAGKQLGKIYTDTIPLLGPNCAIHLDNKGFVYISTPRGKLLKYTDNGTLIWGISPGIGLASILTDAYDNVYVAAATTGYVQKYNSNGNLLWSVRNGDSDHVRTSLITADASGAIYVAGTFDADTDFLPGGNTHILTSSGSQNTYIQKLTSSGNYIWAVQTKGTVAADSAQPYDLKIDDGGTNIYVTGRLTGTVNFNTSGGTSNVTSKGLGDVFVLKIKQCK